MSRNTGSKYYQEYLDDSSHYKKHTDSSIIECAHRLALMYYYGKSVPVKYSKAFKLFRKCFSDDRKDRELPYVHYQIDSDTNIPQRTLVYRITYTLELNADSFYYLGLMHKYGQGVIKDEGIARGHFQGAVKHGRIINKISHNNLVLYTKIILLLYVQVDCSVSFLIKTQPKLYNQSIPDGNIPFDIDNLE